MRGVYKQTVSTKPFDVSDFIAKQKVAYGPKSVDVVIEKAALKFSINRVGRSEEDVVQEINQRCLRCPICEAACPAATISYRTATYFKELSSGRLDKSRSSSKKTYRFVGSGRATKKATGDD